MNAQSPKRIYEILGLLLVGKGEKTKRIESRMKIITDFTYLFRTYLAFSKMSGWKQN